MQKSDYKAYFGYQLKMGQNVGWGSLPYPSLHQHYFFAPS